MKRVTFLILCIEGALLSFNVAATAALIPSIAKEFGVLPVYAVKIVWLYMLPYGLAALMYGPLVRAFDARKVELTCIFLFSLANLLAAISKDINTLFVSRIFMGLFGASVIPLALILVARHSRENNRGRLVGIFFSATFAASLLGLLLSSVVYWRLIYLTPAICGFFVWGLMYLYLPSFKDGVSGFKVNYSGALANKAFVSVFTYIFFISLIYHGIQQWLSVYFSSDFGFSQFTISALITLASLSGILGEVLGGVFADTLGRLRSVNLGIILMIAGVFSLIFKLPLFILGIIMFIWGLGWTINHAGLSTLLTDLPQKFLNEAASLNSGIRFISGGIGVYLGGVFIRRSFDPNFIVFGSGLVILLLFSRRILRG